jgi:hypothetical protein
MTQSLFGVAELSLSVIDSAFVISPFVIANRVLHGVAISFFSHLVKGDRGGLLSLSVIASFLSESVAI